MREALLNVRLPDGRAAIDGVWDVEELSDGTRVCLVTPRCCLPRRRESVLQQDSRIVCSISPRPTAAGVISVQA